MMIYHLLRFVHESVLVLWVKRGTAENSRCWYLFDLPLTPPPSSQGQTASVRHWVWRSFFVIVSGWSFLLSTCSESLSVELNFWSENSKADTSLLTWSNAFLQRSRGPKVEQSGTLLVLMRSERAEEIKAARPAEIREQTERGNTGNFQNVSSYGFSFHSSTKLRCSVFSRDKARQAAPQGSPRW